MGAGTPSDPQAIDFEDGTISHEEAVSYEDASNSYGAVSHEAVPSWPLNDNDKQASLLVANDYVSHEAVPHEAVSPDAVSHEAFSHEAVSHEAVSHEAVPSWPLDHHDQRAKSLVEDGHGEMTLKPDGSDTAGGGARSAEATLTNSNVQSEVSAGNDTLQTLHTILHVHKNAHEYFSV